MSTSEPPTEKPAKKRPTYEQEPDSTVQTCGSAKKESKFSTDVEPSPPPKRLRASSPESRNQVSGSKKRKPKSDKGPGSNSDSNDSKCSDSQSKSGYSDSDSEDSPKGKKKAKGSRKKRRSKSNSKRKSKSKASDPELSDEEAALSDGSLSPETWAAIHELIKNDRKKKKSKKNNLTKPGTETEVKREDGGGTQEVTESQGHSIIVNYLRTTLFQLTGWKNMYDIEQPLEGSDDKDLPKCWKISSNGDHKLCPRIEDSFDLNWKLWGPDFLRQWRDESMMGVNVKHLSEVSDDTIKKKFSSVTWKSMREAWKRNKDGPEARTKKNLKSADRGRATTASDHNISSTLDLHLSIEGAKANQVQQGDTPGI